KEREEDEAVPWVKQDRRAEQRARERESAVPRRVREAVASRDDGRADRVRIHVHRRERERRAERRERPRDARGGTVAHGLAEQEPRLCRRPRGAERDDERRTDLTTKEPARREDRRQRVALHEPWPNRRCRHMR